MYAGGVGDHAVEVKKDGIVLVAADALAIGLPHWSLSCSPEDILTQLQPPEPLV
jgi:hypothetical protein